MNEEAKRTMEKLKMHSPDLTKQNIDRLAELFPSCVTETQAEDGTIKRAIDFDQLRQELSDHIVDGPRERYHLNWPGKREALLAANAPIAKTLRPCREESVDFDTTKNLFIEGDNLDALKLLQETYLNKLKMIYIDPPYNTGHDFLYDDNFVENTNAYLISSNQVTADGGRLIANTEANGRFHSDWLSMLLPRLKLARSLLRDDGAIFISIDEGELAGLMLICDEVFGRDNFIGLISRSTGTRMGEGSRGIARELDYIVVYSRTPSAFLNGLPMTSEEVGIYDQKDERGRYLTRSLRRTGGENRREDRPSMYYAVKSPDGDDIYPIAPEGYESRWVCGKETYKELMQKGEIEWKKVSRNGTERWQVYQKHYLKDALKHPSNLWTDEEGNKKGTRDLNALFDGNKVFDHPKPIGLLQKLIYLGTNSTDNSIVADFFAGSATTAHAVMAQNGVDGGNRRYCLIQIDELLSEDNKSQQIGAKICEHLGRRKTVAELSKERMRRAGVKVKEEAGLQGNNLDVGFRVLKVDTSNMKDVYYKPDALKKDKLFDHVQNIKEDRTTEDLLFQVLLDWGVDLSLPISRELIKAKEESEKKKGDKEFEVFFVDQNALAACFDKGVTEDLVKKIAARKPLRVVFRDAGFTSDAVKINVEQIFKLLSPDTEVRTI
jgi:adenine-specific DNA-methyltransferase